MRKSSAAKILVFILSFCLLSGVLTPVYADDSFAAAERQEITEEAVFEETEAADVLSAEAGDVSEDETVPEETDAEEDAGPAEAVNEGEDAQAEPESTSEEEETAQPEPETAPDDEEDAQAEPEVIPEEDSAEETEPEETVKEEDEADPEAVTDPEESTDLQEPAMAEGDGEEEPDDPDDPENPEDPEDPEPEDPAPVSINKATVTGIEDRVYSGKKQTQKFSVTVTVDGTVQMLSKGTDYNVSYSNNTKAGTAKITIKGIGDYTGTITRSFKIKKAPLSSVKLKYSTMKYRAVPRTQTSTLIVKAKGGDGTITLKRSNFTVRYANNTKVGTASITITGRGNFTGSITKKYKITPVSLRSAKLAYTSLDYTGEARTQTNTTQVRAVVAGNLVTLTKGTDYKISYKNNTKVGTATMTITGKGNFTGKLTKTFKIIPKKTTLTQTKGGANRLIVKWKKQSTETTGYQLQYALNKTFTSGKETITLSNPKTVQKMIDDLTTGKTYYIRIRTYKTVSKKNYYSSWSAVKAATIKQGILIGSESLRTLYYIPEDSSVSGLKVGAWSKKDGQDDLAWFSMAKGEDGIWTAQVPMSLLTNSGTCYAHVYTDKDEYVGAVTFSLTKEELENSVDSRIHEYAKAILDAVGYNLWSAYCWAVNNISYQSLVTPITVPTTGDYAGFTRQELYFAYAYNARMGNCFCYAGTVYWLARELGYTVRLMERKYNYAGGPIQPHGWVEIDIDGTTKILDAEMQHQYGANHYLIYYNQGLLNYMPQLLAY